ncbi:unnamed protein product [Schistosoma margrebowiei]|uniref:Uncharacterized protein n=1 Tax=Schistosoma margrebowiei TaxID=48269 RepID=A0A183MKC2_9TREM|nr:unnamed protein product [Schistosoma margrebowiei]
MVVGGSKQEVLDPGFVLFGTRQQGVPVILRELMLPGGFDLVSPSFTPTTFYNEHRSLINDQFGKITITKQIVNKETLKNQSHSNLVLISTIQLTLSLLTRRNSHVRLLSIQ